MELDGTLTGTTDLVDAMRNLFILDVGLISSIVENERVVLQGVVHPLAQLFLGNHRSRGVVGVAKIDHIHPLIRNLRNEVVLGITGHVDHIRPSTVLLNTCPSDHHIRVDIDGIDRIGNANGVIPAHQFLNVSRITLGTVVDEHLVTVEMNAAREEVVLQDGITQEIVTLLRTVAAESLTGGHLVGSLMNGFNHGGCQRLGNITDAKTDYINLRVGGLEGIHLLGNISEQVVVR